MSRKQRKKQYKIRIPIPKYSEIHKDKRKYNRKGKYKYDWIEEYDPELLDDDRTLEYIKGKVD